MRIVSISLILCLYACVPLNPGQVGTGTVNKTLVYNSRVYEPDVKTVQINPTRNNLIELTQSAVLPISQRDKLVLSFDYLYGTVEDFRARIIHCNSDWKPSNFSNLDILNAYNEFRLDQFEQSFNTRVPYIHYTFELPRVKLPGNYLLVIYRGNNLDDLILSTRFMIVDNLAMVNPQFGLSSGIIERAQNQQIDFTVDYSNLEVSNPMGEIKVVIRQNRRWDNAIFGLKPSFIKDFEKKLSYEFFNLENNFKGGNEFRFFDLRSVNFPGQNVNKIDQDENQITANLMSDKSRKEEAYTFIQDLNGAYIIERVDANNPDTEADYVNVNFFLRAPEQVTGQVFVLGNMNNWEKEKDNRMVYSEQFGGYLGRQLLKQGWYNYVYYLQNSDNNAPYFFEGSFAETENIYEIFIYHRAIGSRGDLLMGYLRINPNSR